MANGHRPTFWSRLLEGFALGLGYSIGIGLLLAVVVFFGGMLFVLLGDRIGILDPFTSDQISSAAGLFGLVWTQFVLAIKLLGISALVLTPILTVMSFLTSFGNWMRDEDEVGFPLPNVDDELSVGDKSSKSLDYVDHITAEMKRARERRSDNQADGGVDFDWLG